MTLRYICSWQHQQTSRKDDGHQRTSIWSLLSILANLAIWARNYPCLFADSMLSKLDKRNTKEGDCQSLPRQGMTILQTSCFTKKSVRYSRSEGKRWMPQHYKGAKCLCRFYSFGSCLLHTSCLLRQQYILLGSSMGLKTRQL